MANAKKTNPSLEELVKQYDSKQIIEDIEKQYQKGTVESIPLNMIRDNHFLKSVPLDEHIIQSAYYELNHDHLNCFILVRKLEKHYEIIDGRKYYLAAKEFKLNKLPVIVISIDDLHMLFTLIRLLKNENNRNIIEIGYLINALKDDFDFTNREISRVTNLSDSQIANIMRVLKLPKEIIDQVSYNNLSFGHAKALSSLDSENALKLSREIITKHLSVRDIESKVRNILKNKKETKTSIAGVLDLKETKTKVTLTFKDEKSKNDFIKKNS